MNNTFSKALGTQCQCDGNCRCGKIVNGKLDCSNCGWSGSESYNALTGKFVCPGCKTENCNNSNNNQMNNQENLNESSFSQGVVGVGIGNDGFLLWNNNPLGTDVSRLNESGFTQETVAYAIGSQGMSLSPFSENPMGASESGFTQEAVAYAIGEQGMALNPFGNSNESNFNSYPQESSADGKLFGFLSGISPHLIIMRDVYCGKYCKSLGYMKSDDKTAFKKCKNSCKINYPKARKGKWKYPEAPAGMESDISPEELAKQSEQVANSTPPQAQQNAQRAGDTQALREPDDKGKMTMWIIIAVVAVVLIVGAIILIKRKKS